MMSLAVDIARRSTCQSKNRKVGCVITDHWMLRVLAFGWNGRERGGPNDKCLAPSNSSRCGCIHAEANALIKADYSELQYATLFVTLEPCITCSAMIVNTGITTVYYKDEYTSHEGLELLKGCGIIIKRFY